MKDSKSWAIVALIIICTILFMTRGCEKPAPVVPDKSDLFSVIKSNKILRDSIEKLSNKTDSIRVEYITRWRVAKSRVDSIPCAKFLPFVINLCDSIIIVDSTEIALLRNVIKIDSTIIDNYRTIVKTDSVTILGLSKEVKKQTRRKRFWQFTTGVVAVIAMVK